MKYLLFAIGISVAFGCVLFACAYPLVQDPKIAGSLAAIPIGGCSKIAELLERREARASLSPHQPTAVHTFQGFAIWWPLMIAYGLLIVVAVGEFASGLAGLIAGGISAALTSESLEALAPKIPVVIGIMGIFIALPIQVITGYLLGRWVGMRCSRFGILVVLISAALGSIGMRALDYALSPEEHYKILYGRGKAIEFVLFQTAVTFALFSLPALLGYWRGRAMRPFKYMQYLLGVLPANTREVLVDIAFDEAQKIATSEPPVYSTTAAASAVPHGRLSPTLG